MHAWAFGVLLIKVAWLLLLVGQPSGAEVFPISDSSYPHIFIQDPVTFPVVWHKKTFGFRLAHSAAVRINSRCVQTTAQGPWHRFQK